MTGRTSLVWVWIFALLLAAIACDRTAPPAPPPPAPSATGAASGVTSAVPAVPDANLTIQTSMASRFEAVVGDWYVASAAGVTGFEVDGSRWRDGTPSTNLADQAKRLYGDRYAEFLDGVKTFAFFPLAIHREAPPSGDVRLRVRFYPLAGKIDQAAGLAFGIAADGSYWGVRANALEDNILFFKVVKGKRTVIDTVRNVPTPTKTWHELAVELAGKRLVVRLDGTKRFEKTLDAVPEGRVGLWSKADSQVLFDAFEIARSRIE